MDKRRDSKKRILKEGESQRKDGRYQYRFTESNGVRKTMYGKTLEELREKEEDVTKRLLNGLSGTSGKTTVGQLVQKCLELYKPERDSTLRSYTYGVDLILKCPQANMPIDKMKKIDAQLWIKELSASGKSYSVIEIVRFLLWRAFEVACDDDLVGRNPFGFRLKSVIQDNRQPKPALTLEQQKIWMDFIKNDDFFYTSYDEYAVLLGTGLRVSEFCGLTKSDIDFDSRLIRVDHQLYKKADGTLCVVGPKSKSGERYIPMSADVCASLKRILSNRKAPKIERIIDGKSGFILLNAYGNPKTSQNIQVTLRNANIKFHKRHPDYVMPNITPHVFRHTFCTNMANAGMQPKTLQYIMGHSDVAFTLNAYAHSNVESVVEQMGQFVDMPDDIGLKVKKNV